MLFLNIQRETLQYHDSSYVIYVMGLRPNGVSGHFSVVIDWRGGLTVIRLLSVDIGRGWEGGRRDALESCWSSWNSDQGLIISSESGVHIGRVLLKGGISKHDIGLF